MIEVILASREIAGPHRYFPGRIHGTIHHVTGRCAVDQESEATVRRRAAEFNVEIARVNATVIEGPPARLGKLDVDRIVAQWRRAHAADPQ
jgi:hypothetical protein